MTEKVNERVVVEVYREVKVLGTDDRPALELINMNGAVKVQLLPKTGGRGRAPVAIADLKAAVEALER